MTQVGFSYYRSLSDFSGTKTIKTLNPNGNRPDDLRFKNWLPRFLGNDGLNKLIILLRKLYKYQGQIDQYKRQLQLRTSEDLGVNERILKKCMKEVMECIRIILICQLCARSSSQDVAISLSRKLSHNEKIEDIEMTNAEDLDHQDPKKD